MEMDGILFVRLKALEKHISILNSFVCAFFRNIVMINLNNPQTSRSTVFLELLSTEEK